MTDVFISYSRADKHIVRRLHDALTLQNRNAWVDWEDIPPTADWIQEIFSAIEAADNLAFVLSPDWVSSETCQQEVAHAIKHNKRLIPIAYKDVDPRLLSEALRRLNWVLLRETDDFDAGVKALIAAFDTDLGWVRAHTRLLTRAIDWEARGRDSSLLLRGKDLVDAEQWRALGPSNEPKPTSLQEQYILNSRSTETARQRRLLASVAFALVLTIALAIFAFHEREAAEQRRQVAESATKAERIAREEERRQRDLAQKQREVAETQQRIAVSRGLAVKADLIRERDGRLIELSGLLAIEALRRLPSPETHSTVRQTFRSLPKFVFAIQQEQAAEIVFSPDGKLVAVAGLFNEIAIRKVGEIGSVIRLAHGDVRGRYVNQIAFSADSRILASAGSDGTVRIWNVASGSEIRRIVHKGGIRVSAVQFSRDGRLVASGDEDGVVVVSPMERGPAERRLKASAWIGRLSFSPDGKHLAATVGAGAVIWSIQVPDPKPRIMSFQSSPSVRVTTAAFDKTGARLLTVSDDAAHLWDVATTRQLSSFKHERLTGAAISPLNDAIATASEDGSVRLWNIKSAREIASFTHLAKVNDLVFSPSGGFLATGSEDGTCRVWDVRTGHEVARVGFRAGVTAASFSPDETHIAAASGGEGIVKVWSTVALERFRPMNLGARVELLAFSPDGQLLAAGGAEMNAALFNAATRKRLAKLTAEDADFRDGLFFKLKISQLRFSPDGRYLLTATDAGTVRLWSIPSGQPLSSFRHEPRTDVLSISPNGRYIVTASGARIGLDFRAYDNTVRLWDAQTGNQVIQLKHDAPIEAVAFDQNGQSVYTAADNKARVWNLKGRLLRQFELDSNYRAMAFSPSARHLALAGPQGFLVPSPKVQLLDVQSGQRILTLQGTGAPHLVAFNRTGEFLVTVDTTYGVKLWNVNGGAFRELRHVREVRAAAFSQDGLLLATTDGAVHIWDVRSAEELMRIDLDEEISTASFSQDGRNLATGGVLGTVNVLHVRVDDLIAEACTRLSRNLTRDEWAQYLGGESYRITCSNIPE